VLSIATVSIANIEVRTNILIIAVMLSRALAPQVADRCPCLWFYVHQRVPQRDVHKGAIVVGIAHCERALLVPPQNVGHTSILGGISLLHGLSGLKNQMIGVVT